MVSLQDVQAQLKRLGIIVRYWGAAEIRELPHILMPHENIVNLLNGRYENGFAMLVATDQRLLLIDKKPLYLTVEDIRYDMIAEVDFSARLLDSSITVQTVNKKLNFTSIRHRRLRELTNFIQQRVMELRQHQFAPFIDQTAEQQQAVQITWQQEAAMDGGSTTAQFRPFINPYSRGSLTTTTTRHRFLPKVRRIV